MAGLSAGAMSGVRILPVHGLPEIRAGDPLASLIVGALEAGGEQIRERDVLVVAQKIVSKAEGRLLDLGSVEPSRRALAIANRDGRDPRLVEAVLRESNEIIVASERALIVEHRTGAVCAGAGIDRSNLGGCADQVLLLPRDPDLSARRLREDVRCATGASVPVLVIDTQGRAFRRGVVGVAIGCAGLAPLVDLRGERDRAGRALEITILAQADEIAAAASLVMGQDSQGIPAVLMRGLPYHEGDQPARTLYRGKEEDLFRPPAHDAR